MKVEFDNEYENIGGENLHLRRYDKHKYCLFTDGAGTNSEIFIVEPHWHEWLEIIYIIEGEMRVITPKGTLDINQDNLVVIGMQTLHKIEGNLGDYRYQCLHVNIGFILQNMSPALLDDKMFLIEDKTKALQYFSDIIRLMNHDDIVSQLKYKADILNLLSICLQDSHTNIDNERGEVNDIFSDILFYISTHYQEDLSLQELSEQFGYTTQHISLLFKKNLDTTYYTYLTKLRLDRAKFLLMTTNKRNIDIAIECGFSSEHSLISHFKKNFSETPSQFRKKNMIVS